MTRLSKDNIPSPRTSQISNLVAYTKRINGSEWHMGQLVEYFESHSSVPEDLDEPFVVDYQTLAHDQVEAEFEVGNQLRYFVSTKRLIQLLTFLNNSVLHADATYKLVWKSLKAFVIGLSDKARVFHPLGIGLCSRETQKDFEFIFRSLVLAREKLHLEPLVKVALMVDAAESISLGFRQVFGDEGVRGMCWFHVMSNLKKQFTLIKDDTVRNKIKADIYSLQCSQSQDVFISASRLFLKKWQNVDEAESFLEYFGEQWLIKQQNWFVSLLGRPAASTNNGLESVNGTIKRECTLRELLSIPDWIESSTKLVRDWSWYRDPANVNAKIFSVRPLLEMKDWIKALEYKHSADVYSLSESDVYYVSSSAGMAISSERTLETYNTLLEDCSWLTFDDFTATALGLWKIRLIRSDWFLSECSCPTFFRQFYCKHITALALKEKLVRAPTSAYCIEIGQARGPGRMPKAKKALVSQDV